MSFNGNRKNHIRLTTGDKVYSTIAHVIILLFAFICFYPFWYIIINSISSGAAQRDGVYFLPRDLFFETYISVLTDGRLLHGMYISGMRVVFTILTQITFSAMFAFLMTREKMKFRKFVYRYAIITMYVSGGLIPWYIIMRAYGLFNNFAVYIIPYMFSAFYVILIKTYIESIPSELEEAARIDGAGFITTFFLIILPVCKPILATCALFTAVGTWNMFFDNFLMVSDPNLQTVQIELFNFIREAESIARTMRQMAASGVQNREFLESLRDRMSVDGVRNVTTIVSMLPIMIIYPFLQKYFARGIMLGAVKG